MPNFVLMKLPCISDAIKQHILRAYFQYYLWKMSAFIEFPALDPINYAYNDDCRILMPVMYCKEELPVDYPGPCFCIKCAQNNGCSCSVKYSMLFLLQV